MSIQILVATLQVTATVPYIIQPISTIGLNIRRRSSLVF